jgi:hypothetical protein
MLDTLKRGAVIIAVATGGLFAASGTAQAASPVALSAVAVNAATTRPTSKIEGTGTALRFVPKSVTAAPTTGTCTASNYSFLVVNDTKVGQQVMYMGAALGKIIKPKNGLLVCANGAGTGKLSVKRDPKAILSFTIT